MKIGTSVLEECIPYTIKTCLAPELQTQSSLISEALQLTATGMSIVFIFLSILVLVVKVASFIINKCCTADKELDNVRQNAQILNPNDLREKQCSGLQAAIFAAVYKFRQRK